MAVEKMTENVEVVQTLSTYPNQEEGLSAEQLKAKFDQGPKALKEYLNNVLVPAVQGIQDAMDAGEQYGLDTTLSVPGRAADAAAVGTALAGKAPAGYGLGGTAVRTENWNTAINNGFYFGITNAPDESWWYGYVVRDGADENRITQTVYRNGIICTRTGTISDMGLWEYVNPPMAVGVEYRTTKRWRDKPVYTMCINGGGLPAGGSTTVNIPTSGTTENIIFISSSGYGSRYFPSTKIAGGALAVEFETGVNNIGVYVSQDFLGGLEYYITVEYTLA
jgi:hypothetical protein